jgi:hypothetical protein
VRIVIDAENRLLQHNPPECRRSIMLDVQPAASRRIELPPALKKSRLNAKLLAVSDGAGRSLVMLRAEDQMSNIKRRRPRRPPHKRQRIARPQTKHVSIHCLVIRLS